MPVTTTASTILPKGTNSPSRSAPAAVAIRNSSVATELEAAAKEFEKLSKIIDSLYQALSKVPPAVTDSGLRVNAPSMDYTAVAADNKSLISFDSGSAQTLTLPAVPPSQNWYIAVQNIGAGTLTIDRNGRNIDGLGTNLSLTQFQGLMIYTDGTDYFSVRGTGSGGGGTVTSVTATSPLASSGGTTPNISIASPIPIADGGTGTATPALVPGTNVTITGSWPNQTINAASSGGTVTHTGALTADLPVFGNGAADIKVGTKTGNTNQVVSATGANTAGHPLLYDASGNAIISSVQGNTTQVQMASGSPTAGYALVYDANGNAVPGSGPPGTVSSVALTAPGEFSVSGSPVTGSGTIAITKANETANTVWAGPTSGGAAQPAFRALVAADIPSQPYDMWMYFSYTPTASFVLFGGRFPRPVAFLANWGGSQGAPVAINATATFTVTVAKNGSTVGTISISTSGVYTFATSGGSAVSFATTDYVTFTAPGTPDATLLGFGWTLSGSR